MTTPVGTITVYWRPGCVFCSRLLRELHGRSVPFETENIWDDPVAAETFRRVTGGNETVPTVQGGDRFLVNPTVDQVLAAVHDVDPYGALLDPRRSPAATRGCCGFSRAGGGNPWRSCQDTHRT